MAEPGDEIIFPSGDLAAPKKEGEQNWNKLYILVLLFNVLLVTIFYLLGHFFNHLGA